MKYERQQECIDLVEELNDIIVEDKFLENIGIYFSYSTDGYSDNISIGDICIYCSDHHSLSEYDYELDDYVDITLREAVIKKVYKLLQGFRVLSPFIYKQIKQINNEKVQN